MPTLVTKTCGPGKEFTTFAAIRSYVNALDLIALDQTIELRCTGTIACPNFQTIGPLTSDDTHRVAFLPEAGAGVNDLERTVFDQGGSGAALSFVRNGETSLSSGVDIYDMRWLVTGGTTSGSSATGCTSRNPNSTYDNIIMRNRIYDTSVAEGNLLSAGNQTNKTKFADNLIMINGGLNKTVIFESSTALIERNTAIALGNAIGDAKFHRGTNNTILRNNVLLGFSYISIIDTTAGTGNFSNRTPTQGKTSGVTVLTTTNGLVVNDTSDFRPKTGGPVVDGADDTANVTQDIIGSNRGGSPDSGAWQLSAFLPIPTGRITNYTSVNGTVTLTGTTTNNPSSGVASLTPVTSQPYNSGVAKGPISITLGTGTFTVSFPDTLAGLYLPSVTLTNNGGTQGAVNDVGNVSVVAATGTLTSQTLDGQILTFTGTVSGNPDSGSILINVATDSPNGGSAIGPVALTINGSNFSGSVPPQPGAYSEPILRFTNARGTSLPIAGTTGFFINGIEGNPQAPDAEGDPNAPTVTSVTVSPTTANGSTTFSATVVGTNSPAQSVLWATTAGTISNAGVFTAPPATSSVQTITVTATSVLDPTKSGTATVTIAAAANSTVTGVSVSPATATGSTTFVATVSGTNNPSPLVTWSATGGTINSSGVFIAPAPTNVQQNITVTATSQQNPSFYGTASVTIAALAGSTVTGVSVSPDLITVGGGTAIQITALVSGTGNVSQNVLWSAASGQITSTGLFVAPAATAVEQSIFVTATSVQDPTKSAIATVKVRADTAGVIVVNPMRHFSHNITNRFGVAVEGAFVTVTLTGSGEKPELYADKDKLRKIFNPLVTNDEGLFEFYVEAVQCDYSVRGNGIAPYTRKEIFDIISSVDLTPVIDGIQRIEETMVSSTMFTAAVNNILQAIEDLSNKVDGI